MRLLPYWHISFLVCIVTGSVAENKQKQDDKKCPDEIVDLQVLLKNHQENMEGYTRAEVMFNEEVTKLQAKLSDKDVKAQNKSISRAQKKVDKCLAEYEVHKHDVRSWKKVEDEFQRNMLDIERQKGLATVNHKKCVKEFEEIKQQPKSESQGEKKAIQTNHQTTDEFLREVEEIATNDIFGMSEQDRLATFMYAQCQTQGGWDENMATEMIEKLSLTVMPNWSTYLEKNDKYNLKQVEVWYKYYGTTLLALEDCQKRGEANSEKAQEVISAVQEEEVRLMACNNENSFNASTCTCSDIYVSEDNEEAYEKYRKFLIEAKSETVRLRSVVTECLTSRLNIKLLKYFLSKTEARELVRKRRLLKQKDTLRWAAEKCEETLGAPRGHISSTTKELVQLQKQIEKKENEYNHLEASTTHCQQDFAQENFRHQGQQMLIGVYRDNVKQCRGERKLAEASDDEATHEAARYRMMFTSSLILLLITYTSALYKYISNRATAVSSAPAASSVSTARNKSRPNRTRK